MKQAIYIAIMLFTTLSLSAQTTYLVGNTQNYPEVDFDFSNISSAIYAAADGDTIIVYPLISPNSYGSVNFAGKNVYITSLYKYIGDREYIYSTILSGSESSVVTFINNETRGAVLDGFTIKNGRGTQTNIQYDPSRRDGGGIYISNASPTILNCVVENNTATYGGGIAINLTASAAFSPYLAGNVIKNNNATLGNGGISSSGYQATVVFDSVNKNSVFMNNAPANMDIGSGYQQYMSVMLDTFTVATSDPYYIYMSGPFDFSCDHWVLEQVNADMYVSTSGSDTNTGLTHASPLKTIREAMLRISSNPENRNTIHIAPGIYKASEGQVFPVKIKADVILQGAGQDVTVIDLEHNTGAIHSFSGAIRFKVSGLTFRNNGGTYGWYEENSPLVLRYAFDCEISDCHFENNIRGIYAINNTVNAEQPEPVILRNLSFVGNYNHMIDFYLVNATVENIKVLNNSFAGYDLPYHTGGTPIKLSSNQIVRANYTLSNILIASSNDFGVEYGIHDAYGSSAMYIGGSCDVLINNATVVNCFPVVNKDEIYPNIMMSILEDSQVRIYNSIFYNNYTNQIYIWSGQGNSTIYIDHTLFEGGSSMISGTGNLVWGEGNIDEYPNFDYGYEGILDWPYQLMPSSPCVDAGSLAIAGYDWLAGDLLRNQRVVGETVDMGAYEFNGSSDFYVDFVGSPQTGEVPLTVQFTDTSVGYSITSWQWDFENDGVIDSTEQNPVWVYYNTGHTTVRLVVNNGQGSRVKHEYINPRPAEVVNGILQGVVTANGVPLQDAVVLIMETGMSVFTSEWGIYSFAEVVAGDYSIMAMKEGYDDYSFTGLIVVAGEVTTHNIVMSPVSDSDEVAVALATGLVGNYPNPFNPETVVGFNVGKAGFVEVSVYNVRGERVRVLANGLYGAGKHHVVWDGCDDMGRGVGSGVYFYRMRAGGAVETRKMVLVK